MFPLSSTIFRAYDIRGIVGKELNADNVFSLGLALANTAIEKGHNQFMLGYDGRLSSPELSNILIDGLLDGGCDVVNIGLVPTPVLYFATQTVGAGTGVMITGSHNPSNYNGFKISMGGSAFFGEDIQALYKRILEGNIKKQTKGTYSTLNVTDSYLNIIKDQIKLARRLKIVVDCGNGATGEIAPQLLKDLGCEIIPLFCEIDGHFPNHHPDPMVPDNLKDLIKTVKEHKADLGLAFDGDGDRLGLVTETGDIIWPDRQLMLFAADILKRKPGSSIVYDIKCTRLLTQLIRDKGGKPIMSPTGHSLIKTALKREKAPLAGEMSGHIFFSDNWYGFDDAIYSAARMLDLIASQSLKVSDVFAQFPNTINTPELPIPIAEDKKSTVMAALQKNAHFPGAEVITIDGVRADFPKGWGLVRASNTTPTLVSRFEAEDQQTLKRIQQQFREQLLAIAPDLVLPF